MICPECHAEYKPQITQCADCKVTLVNTDHLDAAVADVRWKALTPFEGIVYAEMAGEILALENIPFFIKSDALSTTFSIEGTISSGNTRVFVPEELIEKAELLLDSIAGQSDD
ncbi:MAG: hypothetical protein HN657_08095 [Candidatus Marinimicrobia bacterium]|jgi:hypothetical protein|nr:hypothetical protein [Candidatus Neomarinimicrobiota bacterium]MBT3496551.1 hypothetical protein [Candidatus Neomarinimicrobiota bacterium]MBT3692344.1 hypothetical protein [Candidatus Neomarinimicrobiota bacterium]MBT3731490.1 hypothetical protein [Candidatus Neomarinimicrobiota bacterium]MBT4144905.1 hypothetical protein [Candidatus Neomarinimicrobiota bacterium]